jgi:hypothetical protein
MTGEIATEVSQARFGFDFGYDHGYDHGGDVTDGFGGRGLLDLGDSSYAALHKNDEEEEMGAERREGKDREEQDGPRNGQYRALLLAWIDHIQKKDMTGAASVQHDEWRRIDDSYDANDDAEYDCGSQGIVYASPAGLGDAKSYGADTTSQFS